MSSILGFGGNTGVASPRNSNIRVVARDTSPSLSLITPPHPHLAGAARRPSTALFDFRAGALYDIGPFGDLAPDEVRELLRCSAHSFHPEGIVERPHSRR